LEKEFRWEQKKRCDRMATSDENGIKDKEPEAQTTWAIWVADPLTKDADILLRWSKTSFYVGCPKPTLLFFDGKEHSLFMRSSNFDFIIGRADFASLYYREVRLTRDGTEVNLEPRTKDVPRPPDDLLGCGSSLCGGSC
jgi:hypothetical protein